ncbi:hypothetical protein NDU88_003090 [Pleurodeles waltl]|uniref:Uncharacterized protein n=1 Tax=Pleurodeles waltl TaxID=8319 RepID=A0AAV7VD24_PLEWA|nr:hypothetical protein NDU88_003090 [Pleurodeles waltl]
MFLPSYRTASLRSAECSTTRLSSILVDIVSTPARIPRSSALMTTWHDTPFTCFEVCWRRSLLVAFHLCPKVEAEMRKLEQGDTIERVEGPTPWVSLIVTPRKPKQPGEIRMGVNMHLHNLAMKRELHRGRHRCRGELIIIVFQDGFRAGYHQLLLAPDIIAITTFFTQLSLHRIKKWILQLHGYPFAVVYRPESDLYWTFDWGFIELRD